MILKQFPDINMVKRLRNDAEKPFSNWMNVALNIPCRQVSRLGVESPYSLFLNNRGFSYCDVGRRQYRIETDTFLLTQPGDSYGLTIDNLQQTEICNVHINKDFFRGCAYALTTASAAQLDQPHGSETATPELFTGLYPKDPVMARLTATLSDMDPADTIGFELLLADFIRHLLLGSQQIKSKIARLPFMKAAVRADIYSRLSIACDYIHSNYQSPISLELLSRETGMSRFHFLRMFRSFYGVTPYQYLARVRMTKALDLLKNSRMPVSEISSELGFEYTGSFIKAFQKAYQASPLQYRKQ